MKIKQDNFLGPGFSDEFPVAGDDGLEGIGIGAIAGALCEDGLRRRVGGISTECFGETGAFPLGESGFSDKIRERGDEIDGGDGVGNPLRFYSWAGDDEGHAEELLIDGMSMAPVSVIPEFFAVVGGEADIGGGSEAEGVQLIDQLSYEFVNILNFTFVEGADIGLIFLADGKAWTLFGDVPAFASGKGIEERPGPFFFWAELLGGIIGSVWIDIVGPEEEIF